MRVTILKIWAGLIFVDAVTPVRPDQLSPELRADLYEIPTYEYYIFSMMYGLGLPRVMGQCSKAYAGFEEHTERMLAESVCNSSLSAIWNEYKGWGQSFDETIRTGPYGDLPILIFSHDPQKHSGAGAPSRPELEESVMWNQMQEDLKKLSTRSRRIIFRGSGHEIPLERADLLNKEVLVFVQQIRDEAPQPTNYTTGEVGAKSQLHLFSRSRKPCLQVSIRPRSTAASDARPTRFRNRTMPMRTPHPNEAAFEDQSVCLLNFFFMSGANSPILFIRTPTQACVNTL
jgi:hypothetical protein